MITCLDRPPVDFHVLAPPVVDPYAVDAEFAAITDQLTRRRLLTGGLGTAALLGLAACGSGGSSSSNSGAPAMRTVKAADGTFSVPVHPARVVCIDYFTAIFLIELGLTPVGGIDYSWVNDSVMYKPYVDKLTALADIGEITSTNYEKVTALRPDLILGPTPGSRYDNSKGAMGKLKAVAPVASVDFGQTSDWRGPLAQTAELVNRTAQLDPLIAGYQQTVAQAKITYRDVLASTVVAVLDYSQDGNFALDLSKSTDGLVLADLGVRFSRAASNATGTAELSLEHLGQLADADLILFRADPEKQPTNGLQDLVKLPAWIDLPAVKAGHVYPIGWADLCTYRWAQAAVADFTSILDTYRKDA